MTFSHYISFLFFFFTHLNTYQILFQFNFFPFYFFSLRFFSSKYRVNDMIAFCILFIFLCFFALGNVTMKGGFLMVALQKFCNVKFINYMEQIVKFFCDVKVIKKESTFMSQHSLSDVTKL